MRMPRELICGVAMLIIDIFTCLLRISRQLRV
jgi:hypothetical protein